MSTTNDVKTRMLPVELTNDEIISKAREMATKNKDCDLLTDSAEQAVEAAKAGKKSADAEVKGLRSQIAVLSRAILSGLEDREVEIAEEPDYEHGIMRVRRLDSNEICEERPLREADKQMPLFNNKVDGALESIVSATEASDQIKVELCEESSQIRLIKGDTPAFISVDSAALRYGLNIDDYATYDLVAEATRDKIRAQTTEEIETLYASLITPTDPVEQADPVADVEPEAASDDEPKYKKPRRRQPPEQAAD